MISPRPWALQRLWYNGKAIVCKAGQRSCQNWLFEYFETLATLTNRCFRATNMEFDKLVVYHNRMTKKLREMPLVNEITELILLRKHFKEIHILS